MGIKPNRHRIHQNLAWSTVGQLYAETPEGPQRLYGNPEDGTLKKADGTKCKVTFVKHFNLRANEGNLESRVANREPNPNLGFLPMQLDDARYSVIIYKITGLLPQEDN